MMFRSSCVCPVLLFTFLCKISVSPTALDELNILLLGQTLCKMLKKMSGLTKKPHTNNN